MPIGNATLTDVHILGQQTQPGMAHFAGTGPEGKRCKDCKCFIKKLCMQYVHMTGRVGPTIRGSNNSCKYFEQK